jgi:outer membrane protein assembly factor BamB
VPKEGVSFTDSWPSFRGNPQLTGFVQGSAGDSVLSDEPKLLWTFDAKAEIQSTAAIVGARVFVASAEGVLCLDLEARDKAGKEIWRTKNEVGIQSSPAVRNGKVYLGDDAGIFRALDAKTGNEVWKFDTQSEDGGGQEIISSATFSGKRVLFGSYDSRLYCLSAEGGTFLWKYQTQGPLHSTPVIIEGRTFVAGCDAQLRSVNAETGKEIVTLEMGDYSAASPAVLGDRLIIGTFASEVLCVDWRKQKVVWRYHTDKKSFPYYSSAAVTDQVAVVGGRDKAVHCIGLEDGKRRWRFPTKARMDSSPVIVGSRVVAAGYDGNIYLLDLATGKEIWKFTAGPAFVASPAVGEGRLVISSQEGMVYCFDLRR